jgi:hypothetical protein
VHIVETLKRVLILLLGAVEILKAKIVFDKG